MTQKARLLQAMRRSKGLTSSMSRRTANMRAKTPTETVMPNLRWRTTFTSCIRPTNRNPSSKPTSISGTTTSVSASICRRRPVRSTATFPEKKRERMQPIIRSITKRSTVCFTCRMSANKAVLTSAPSIISIIAANTIRLKSRKMRLPPTKRRAAVCTVTKTAIIRLSRVLPGELSARIPRTEITISSFMWKVSSSRYSNR